MRIAGSRSSAGESSTPPRLGSALRALGGEDDPEALLGYVVGPVKALADDLAAPLTGTLTPRR